MFKAHTKRSISIARKAFLLPDQCCDASERRLTYHALHKLACLQAQTCLPCLLHASCSNAALVRHNCVQHVHPELPKPESLYLHAPSQANNQQLQALSQVQRAPSAASPRPAEREGQVSLGY